MTRKIALITGGSRGLGRSAALHLAAQGVDVIVTYRNQAGEAAAVVAEAERRGARAAALALDTGVIASFADFAVALRTVLRERWQREQFDFLVNNAGMGLHAGFAETTEAQFDALVNVHFKGAYFLTQKFIPNLNSGGRIINIASGAGLRPSLTGIQAYTSAKHALVGLTKQLSQDLGPKGITCNAIAPGFVRSNPATEKQWQSYGADGQARLVASIHTRRLGRAEDIAYAVLFLASEQAGWISGQILSVDGGRS